MVSNSSEIPPDSVNIPRSHLSSVTAPQMSLPDLRAQQKIESSSSDDSSSKSAHECRICFQQISPVVSRQHPQSHRSLLLKNPCACKGSLSYVHEACLVKWLVQRDIRRCELCHQNFVIREEYHSIPEMIRQVVCYISSSNRRLLKVTIYAIYLYLFFKRFTYVVKYYKSIILNFISGAWRSIRMPSLITSLKLRQRLQIGSYLTKK